MAEHGRLAVPTWACSAAAVSQLSALPLFSKQARAPDQLPAVLTAAEAGVPGLELLPEFVSAEEEAALLALADGQPWRVLARRRVQHYGHTFHYEVGMSN